MVRMMCGEENPAKQHVVFNNYRCIQKLHLAILKKPQFNYVWKQIPSGWTKIAQNFPTRPSSQPHHQTKNVKVSITEYLLPFPYLKINKKTTTVLREPEKNHGFGPNKQELNL
ncbi:hypothetical protein NQ317_018006 [Molorchus minor]|uniref:Uncharacterized protein n=1 Tax=Molorchus minor TaxID=1323400 RepID=A0ABQ9JRY7_9CUCU|nr:hypothetical protein NQ317_018006 [Molorchus minor]